MSSSHHLRGKPPTSSAFVRLVRALLVQPLRRLARMTAGLLSATDLVIRRGICQALPQSLLRGIGALHDDVCRDSASLALISVVLALAVMALGVV